MSEVKCQKEEKQSMRILQSGKAVRETASTRRRHQSDRHLRRHKERDRRKSLRDRRTVARAVETMVNPTEDGTGSRITATLHAVQNWENPHPVVQHDKGLLPAQQGAAPGHQHWVSCAFSKGTDSTVETYTNPRKKDDGLLLIVPVRVYGHCIRALIDSGATRCFVSAPAVKPLGLSTVHENTFLELGDGQKILSRGKVLNVPIVTAGLTVKMDLTVTSLLHEVDLILGINWLQLVNPLIDWCNARVFLPRALGTPILPSTWLDAQQRIGTVRVLSSTDDLNALTDAKHQSAISVLKTPQFWEFTRDENTRWCLSYLRGSKKCELGKKEKDGKKEKEVNELGICKDSVCKNDHCKESNCKIGHNGCISDCNMEAVGDEELEVKRLNNNATIPKRGTDGSAGYDLSSAVNCTIPAKSRGIVKTGLAVRIPPGTYARIAPRSGLTVKKSIDIGAGVVDADYRGEIGVVLINQSDHDFQVKQGDRIAQLILEKIKTPAIKEVETLDETSRGAAGFGSTGVETSQSKEEKPLKEEKSKDSGISLNTLRKNKAQKKIQIISAQKMKKLIKRKEPCFLAIIRPTSEEDVQQKGMTQKVKREMMKEKGAVRAAPPVEETRNKICFDAPEEIRTELSELLKEYKDLFLEKLPKGRPPKRAVEFEINTVPDATIPSRPPYRLSPKESEELQAQIDELIAQGHIRPSQSPYGAPVLFVPKKDGRWRMCVDYRALNKQTIKDKYPLPRIDDLIDRLGQARHFTTLDLASGYHQIAVKDADIYKTAFRTQRGQFEFLVMPFGVTNAPATFQRLMNNIFKDELDTFISVYLDDILVFSRTVEEHLQHVRIALEKLRKAKLYARLHKCEFFKTRVEYLGFDVSAQGIAPSQDKVKAVVEWPKPGNVRDIRSFLGLAGFYRRFIRNFSQKARPLTDLTKDKTPWKWESAEEKAFQELKESLVTAPVLRMPDFEKPFVLTTDASAVAIGAILE